MLRSFFTRLKSGTEYLNYGRHILRDWGAQAFRERGFGLESQPFRVLDLGCGHGTDLKNIRGEIERRYPNDDLRQVVELHGVESYPPYIAECRAEGIRTHSLNIERDLYPGEDGSFDVIVANQILEHTKEIFWIFAECARLLKPGGYFLIGVPNLASLHNRFLLFLGQQPTQIKSMSAHVRGFTKPDMREFAQTGGLFRLRAYRGSNFYPLPPLLSKPLARVFPTLAWGSFYRLERTEADGDFLTCLGGDENFLETPFYGSPQNPAKQRANNRRKVVKKKPAAKKKKPAAAARARKK